MLRFFRTIRKKLIEEDNVRKYLLYAIGEILLVVTGILIALQVNNWNAQSTERKIAERYVIDIKRDITIDLQHFEDIAVFNADRRKSALAILHAIETLKYDDPGVFMRRVDLAGRFSGVVVQRTTYDDLVATGGLRLLDKDLRDIIAEYYRFIETQTAVFEMQRTRVWDNYLPVAVTALPLDAQRWVYTLLGQEMIPFPGANEIDAESTFDALTTNSDAANALKAVVRGTWSIDRQIDVMGQRAQAVLAKLEAAQ